MSRGVRIMSDTLCVFLAVFAIAVAAFGVFDVVIVSGLSVLLGMIICLIRLEIQKGDQFHKLWQFILHGAMALALFGLFFEWGWVMFAQEEFFISITVRQLAFAWIAIGLLGYLTLHYFGKPMLAVVLVATGYLLLPESIGGAGVEWSRAAENLWFSSDGVFGRPVEVVGRIVLIFIVFGAVMQQSGAGEILLKLALAATGRFSGGPAHAAIAASALFGSLSGTAIANVVSTGIFTIPIIKRLGFKPKFAGAVEAAASTGGQIMPPVMGVVAFLMADVTGIPYLKIIVAALIPSIMYYSSLFVVVYIESKKLRIEAIPKSERVKLTSGDWLKSLAFIVPLGVIIAVLVTGRTAQNAGFYAMVSSFFLCLIFFPAFRNPKRWLDALIDSGKTSAVLMVIVAMIGFVIGVINMTGVGLMFAEKVLGVASTNLWLALIFVMLSCLVMGMGVPTGAAYLMIAIVLGPVLHGLGLSLMASHLFVVYFGVLSVVTPPVALAAFAAAPIAGSRPMETALEASRLSVAGFIIPYMFVFHPDLLLVVGDLNFGGLIWALFIFSVATWGLATSLGGWEFRDLPAWQRGARLLSAILLIIPGVSSAIIGIGLLSGSVVLNWQAGHRFKNKSDNLKKEGIA